eukprot:TRINITY_DN6439_c0_g1_i2.p1 TRINITY_DN6439_c0_g1~~TRINITY_DN6439_c0_g1_i2.p1  ORF type:complete len:508 (+),score=124.07 TRINITY_DN6439_c0_g1_i2:289-1812(+)
MNDNYRALVIAIAVVGCYTCFSILSDETSTLATSLATQTTQLTMLESARSNIALVPKDLTYFNNGTWEAELVFAAGELACQREDDDQTSLNAPSQPPPGIRMDKRPIVLANSKCPRVADLDAGMCVMDKESGKMGCLPSFIVIGAMKAGTAEVQGWLSQHPNMYRWGGPSDSGAGEAHFFDSLKSDEDLAAKWKDDYVMEGLVLPRGPEDARSVYTFEKTPRYLMLEESAVARIHKLVPSVRLLAILRNPVSRAYSHFQHRCSQGRVYVVAADAPAEFAHRVLTGPNPQAVLNMLSTDQVKVEQIKRLVAPCPPEAFDTMLLRKSDGTFRDRIDPSVRDGGILTRGMYHIQLQRYLKYFHRDQLLLLLTEEMFGDFVGAMDQVMHFLQLPYYNYSSRTYVNERGFTVLEGLGSKANNKAYQPMTPLMKNLLTQFYKPITARLGKYVEPERLQRHWHDVASEMDLHIDQQDDDQELMDGSEQQVDDGDDDGQENAHGMSSSRKRRRRL